MKNIKKHDWKHPLFSALHNHNAPYMSLLSVCLHGGLSFPVCSKKGSVSAADNKDLMFDSFWSSKEVQWKAMANLKLCRGPIYIYSFWRFGFNLSIERVSKNNHYVGMWNTTKWNNKSYILEHEVSLSIRKEIKASLKNASHYVTLEFTREGRNLYDKPFK